MLRTGDTQVVNLPLVQTSDDPLKVAVRHLKDETYNPNDDVLKVTVHIGALAQERVVA